MSQTELENSYVVVSATKSAKIIQYKICTEFGSRL